MFPGCKIAEHFINAILHLGYIIELYELREITRDLNFHGDPRHGGLIINLRYCDFTLFIHNFRDLIRHIHNRENLSYFLDKLTIGIGAEDKR